MNHWKRWKLTSFICISWWVLCRPLYETNHSRKYFVGKLLLARPLQGCPWLLQELWCILSLCTKVYCEWLFTPHTTFGTFWKMGNWFNGAITKNWKRALIHCGCHMLLHKVCKNMCLEIINETRSNMIYVWTSLYSIWDTIQNCFW